LETRNGNLVTSLTRFHEKKYLGQGFSVSIVECGCRKLLLFIIVAQKCFPVEFFFCCNEVKGPH